MIKANAVGRNYGKVVALKDVSFEIWENEIVGLLGHNGAGKTTIMKMITGYLEPSSGSITVNGLDAFRQRTQIQQEIGYLPENCPLYPDMTVFDYLEYAARLRAVPSANIMGRIASAVEKSQLNDVTAKRISMLSKGYRQRLGMAQAILHSPRLLVLDEPTSGLDPSQIFEMRALIQGISQASSIVISTHILQEVEAICNRVIIISGGKVALDSKMEALKASGQLKLVTDGEPSACLELFANSPLKIVEHKAKENRYIYILESQNIDISNAAELVARTLVQNDCRVYALEPIIRNLETTFAEIAKADRQDDETKGGLN